MDTPGQYGLSVQRKGVLSAIEGQFGISVQLASNARIQIFDQLGKPVKDVVLTITYFTGATTYVESQHYDYNRPVNRAFPETTPIYLTVSGAAFYNLNQTVQVASGAKETFRLVLTRKSSNQLIRRRVG